MKVFEKVTTETWYSTYESFVLNTHTLYLVCGVQGVGKSTFIENTLLTNLSIGGKISFLTKDCVLNVDALLSSLYTGPELLTPYGVKYGMLEGVSNLASDFLYKFVEARLAQRLTTVVDAVMTSDSMREAYVQLANKYHMDVGVILLTDTEIQIKRNVARRKRHVPMAMVENSLSKMTLTSKYPHLVVDKDLNSLTEKKVGFKACLHDNYTLPEGRTLDFISDIHGLYEPMLELLDKLGYVLTAEGIPEHPDGNCLVFLGDVVDRGPDSLKVLDFVRQACLKGGHRMVLGNHEYKLLTYLQGALKEELVDVKSRAAMETGILTLSKSREWKQNIVSFLMGLPGYLVSLDSKVLVQHSDCIVKFNPAVHPLNYCLGGKGIKDEFWDTDKEWSRLNPDWTLIRGHIMPTSEEPVPSVKVVFNEGEFGGTLVGYRVPSVEGKLSFKDEKTYHIATGFDYAQVRKEKPLLSKELDALVRDKLVYKVFNPKEGLILYSYQNKVHYDKKWLEGFGSHTDAQCYSVLGSALSEARGTILSMTGDLVLRPFYKVLNAGEYNLGLTQDANGRAIPNFEGRWDDDVKVQVVDKHNGYALFATMHPYKDEMLLSTQGAFGQDAPYVKMARAFMEKTKTFGKYLALCRAHRGYTLAFEVVLAEDPHICSYPEDRQGLYLIGARHTVSGAVVSEEELDAWWESAAKVGFRAAHRVATIREVRAMAATEVNKEGVILRCIHTGQLLMKWKFKWYLTKKFFERLPAGKMNHLFKNPSDFKKLVDEEYYGLVDFLVQNYTLESFKALTEQERASVVSSAFWVEDK